MLRFTSNRDRRYMNRETNVNLDLIEIVQTETRRDDLIDLQLEGGNVTSQLNENYNVNIPDIDGANNSNQLPKKKQK